MPYTTTKGNTVPLTPKLWRGIKRVASKNFDGSEELFDACWRQYRTYVNGAIDDPEDLGDVLEWLDSIAAEKVNNPRSRFYMYG
jgi:hypothetical protein